MPDGSFSDAKGVHICTTNVRSGIADYAIDFHDLVLKPEGYVLCDPAEMPEAQSFAPGTRFHIQLGIFQRAERQILSNLLREGDHRIEVTLHDPPFLTFPYYQFRSTWMMRLSRVFDWYLRSFGIQRRVLERLSRIFVLSESGRRAVLRLAPQANVEVIPIIVRKDHVWPAGTPLGPELLYFGFVGKGKGLDYALDLHARIRELRPGTHLHVVGQAQSSSAKAYLAKLQEKYCHDVTFCGYVPASKLDPMFEQAAHVLLPYKEYGYVVPVSGSVMHALRRGRIVWTTPANAMPDLIRDGENGFMLSMDVANDAARIAAVMDNPDRARQISNNAREFALGIADFPFRSYFSAAGRQ